MPPTTDNAALVPPVLETDEEVARILLGAASSRIEQEIVAVAATRNSHTCITTFV